MRSPADRLTMPTTPSPGDLGGRQCGRDAHDLAASANNLPPATFEPEPVFAAPGADLGTDQRSIDAQTRRVGADLNGDHKMPGVQEKGVAVSEGNGQSVGVPRWEAADPSDALLQILADSLNDIEGLRKATSNQLSALIRSSDVPGGKGLSENSRAAVMLADRLALLEQFEHKTVLELKRTLRAHPLGSWVKDTVGIGEKQGARLIAAIGHPAWNTAEGRPRRGPAELWAYCGYAPDQKRRKGVQSNWNAEAKMRAFLCAESCMKQRSSPFRKVYDDARANWADRDTSDAHKHAHALRCVAKAILKDLWLAARAVADPEPNGHAPAFATGGES